MQSKEEKFSKVKEFTWSPIEVQANRLFTKLKFNQYKTFPKRFFEKNTLKGLAFMQKSRSYQILDKMPKGVLHHIHLQCNDDLDFYKKYIFQHPDVYLTHDLSNWKIGTNEEALANNWITINEAKKLTSSTEQFQKKILSITQIVGDEIERYSYSDEAWQIFEKKIGNFLGILTNDQFFKKYAYHMVEKYIQNGYQRVQFRCFCHQLKIHNKNAYLTKQDFIAECEQVEKLLQKKYPYFTLGLIVNGFKMHSDKFLKEYLENIFQITSQLIVGIDFVNQEDKYDHFQHYEKILDQVRNKCKSVCARRNKSPLSGVFHAGESKEISNQNIKQVIKYGTKRIGHGVNLMQHSYLINEIKKQGICIEICPLSNQFLGYVYDLKQHPAIAYYHLGIPISISSDDAGKFGYSGVTPDFYVACHAFGFDLKDMKLLGIYSILHSLCQQDEKVLLLKKFNEEWMIFIAKVKEGLKEIASTKHFA